MPGAPFLVIMFSSKQRNIINIKMFVLLITLITQCYVHHTVKQQRKHLFSLDSQ